MSMKCKGFGAGNREMGASAVEFALIGPVFLLMMLAIVELSVLFWYNLTMQHAVREGVRYAVTGQGATPAERRNQIVAQITRHSMGLFTRLNTVITVNEVTYSNPDAYPGSMFGSGGNPLVVRLDCTAPAVTPIVWMLFPNGYSFSVASALRNEEFQEGGA